MLFLATFFPASDTVVGQFDILGVRTHIYFLNIIYVLDFVPVQSCSVKIIGRDLATTYY